jgi:Protein of unknown function (DUF2846)
MSHHPTVLLLSVAAVVAGCTSVSLRPRSIECTLAVVVAPGASCQPMPRASQALDSEAKKFATVEGKANVYIVRPSIVGGRRVWDIQVDGKHAGLIAEHTYLLLVVEPGAHEVSVLTNENRHAITINATPGQNHFVEVVSRIGWTESRAELREVPREQGETAVRGSRLAEPL